MGRRIANPLTLLGLGEAQRTRRCRLCREPLVEKRRTAWCGDACVERWRLANGDQALFRRLVLDRDAHTCRLCGLDGRLLGRVVDRLFTLDRERWLGQVLGPAEQDQRLPVFLLRALGWGNRSRACWDILEADHVLPLVENGANTIENGRTLCVPCHARETAALAGRRAVALRARRAHARAHGRLALFPGEPER